MSDMSRGKSSTLRTAQQKLRAIATAQRTLQRRLEDIDWRENELNEALRDLEFLAAAGEQLPTFELVPGTSSNVINHVRQITAATPDDAPAPVVRNRKRSAK
jgi:prefoldin subunit 5